MDENTNPNPATPVGDDNEGQATPAEDVVVDLEGGDTAGDAPATPAEGSEEPEAETPTV